MDFPREALAWPAPDLLEEFGPVQQVEFQEDKSKFSIYILSRYTLEMLEAYPDALILPKDKETIYCFCNISLTGFLPLSGLPTSKPCQGKKP